MNTASDSSTKNQTSQKSTTEDDSEEWEDASEDEEEEEEVSASSLIGHRVAVRSTMKGVVRFFGEVHYAKVYSSTYIRLVCSFVEYCACLICLWTL
jgi:hypothetical protein